MPASQSSRPSADTDQALIWLFALALGSLLLIRWWPYQPQSTRYAGAYPEQPAVYEEVTPAPESAAPEPQTQADWERGSTFPQSQQQDWEAPVETEEKVYTYVEQMPEPPGSQAGLQAYLRTNTQYPSLAARNNVAGKVLVSFVVDTDGQLRDARVEQGLGAGCDEEALRVIRQMPAWTPGRQNGQPVSVRYTVPVTFPANW